VTSTGPDVERDGPPQMPLSDDDRGREAPVVTIVLDGPVT
jgi:hypothetical protein